MPGEAAAVGPQFNTKQTDRAVAIVSNTTGLSDDEAKKLLTSLPGGAPRTRSSKTIETSVQVFVTDAPKALRKLTVELGGPPLSDPLFDVTPQTVEQIAKAIPLV